MSQNPQNPQKPLFPRRKFKIHTVDEMSNSEYIIYRREGKKGYAMILRALVYIIIVLVLLGSCVYFQTIQSQLNSEYETLSAQLNVITSENVRLQVKLESELSNDAIEQIARDIGMEELSNSSIEYITFNPVAQAEVIAKGNVFERVVDWCEGVVLKLKI